MTKFERHMEDLEAYCKEFGCDKRDAMMDQVERIDCLHRKKPKYVGACRPPLCWH